MGIEVMTIICGNQKAFAPLHECDCKHTGDYTLFAQGRMLRGYAKAYLEDKDLVARERGLSIKSATVKLFHLIKDSLSYVDADGNLKI